MMTYRSRPSTLDIASPVNFTPKLTTLECILVLLSFLAGTVGGIVWAALVFKVAVDMRGIEAQLLRRVALRKVVDSVVEKKEIS